MTRRMIAVVLATAVLALLLAAAAPRAEAVSFVDKQVQAGALLIQKYINDYGQSNRFVYPPKSMVKKGGGLPGSTSHLAVQPLDRQGHGTRHLARHLHVHPERQRRHVQVRRPPVERQLAADGRRSRPGSNRSATLHRSRTCCCSSGTSTPTRPPHGDYPATGSLTPDTFPSPTLRVAEEPVDRRGHGGERRPRRLLLHGRQRDRLHAQGQADQRWSEPSARSRC